MTGPTPDEVSGELHIINGWLVQDTGEHTCAGGGPEAGGAHERGCGLEPLATVEDVLAALAARTPQPAEASPTNVHAAAWLDRLRVAPDGALWTRMGDRWARHFAGPAWQHEAPEGCAPLVAPQPAVLDETERLRGIERRARAAYAKATAAVEALSSWRTVADQGARTVLYAKWGSARFYRDKLAVVLDVAPQPAVPDGGEIPEVDDATDRAATVLAIALTTAEVTGADTTQRVWQHAVTARMLRSADEKRGHAPDGDDVPARLDAAGWSTPIGSALEAVGDLCDAADRRSADLTTAEVRAAVAAALGLAERGEVVPHRCPEDCWWQCEHIRAEIAEAEARPR